MKTGRTGLIIAVVLFALSSQSVFAHPFDETYRGSVDFLDSYKTMANDNPEDVELQYLYADMLVIANKLDEAEQAVLKRVIAQDPKYDMAYYLLSEVYYRQKKFEKSLEPLRKIRAKDMKDDVLIAEATIYLKLKKPAVCMKKAREAIKVDPKNPGGLLHVGLAYVELGKTAEGIKNIEASLRMEPGQPLVYDWLTQLYENNLSEKQHLEKLEGFLKWAPAGSDFAARVNKDITDLKNRMNHEIKK